MLETLPSVTGPKSCSTRGETLREASGFCFVLFCLCLIVNIQTLLEMTSSLPDVSSDPTRMKQFKKIKSSFELIECKI